eukprot:365947-Chlamydomonas_euryale.AAC.9
MRYKQPVCGMASRHAAEGLLHGVQMPQHTGAPRHGTAPGRTTARRGTPVYNVVTLMARHSTWAHNGAARHNLS